MQACVALHRRETNAFGISADDGLVVDVGARFIKVARKIESAFIG